MIVRDTVQAWRLWYTRPAEAELTLYAPTSRAERVRSTRDRITYATCIHGHEPPAVGCECGIYAVGNVVDAIYRFRIMTHNIRTRTVGWFPSCPDDGMVAVLAAVTMHRVASETSPAIPTLQIVVNDDGSHSLNVSHQRAARPEDDDAIPELRAASAEITRLFIEPEAIDTDAAPQLAARLAQSYGCEASVGFPEYTAQDWDTRPRWMFTQPMAALCEVDAMLTGFNRDGTHPWSRAVATDPRLSEGLPTGQLRTVPDPRP